MCLAAADDATRQRCVRIIQAASASVSSSLQGIACAVALTRDLIDMQSLPAVNAVLAALGKAAAKGLDAKSLKEAGVDSPELQAAAEAQWMRVAESAAAKMVQEEAAAADAQRTRGAESAAAKMVQEEAAAADAQRTRDALVGIGLVLKSVKRHFGNSVISIENIIEGGPADKSQKFLKGDFLVEVGGTPTVGVEFDTVLSLLRGEIGTLVTIVVARVTDIELMERTATDDNPFGECADIISIELKRDAVKRIDLYEDIDKGVVAALKQVQTLPRQRILNFI